MSEQQMIANRYMVVSSLGSGGMADVYLAIDTILNREVAVKVLRGDAGKDPVALVRFQREASATSRLHHPNVVEVYDVGESEGRSYIVMEYVRGKTLKQLIRQRGALPVDEAVSIMKQLTSAVAHAHDNNLIHRDIKPQNVLVKDDGTVKITDFGIALAHDAVQLTQNDSVLGSAHYIAPETTRGEIATVKTDIYSLGIVFYELLTGDVPYNGDNPVQIAMMHMREDLPSVRDFNKKIPQSVENIIIRATAKNKTFRYENAQDMLFDLEVCLTPEMMNADKVVFETQDTPKDGTVVFDQSVKTQISSTGKQPVANDNEYIVPNKDDEKKKKRRKFAAIGVLLILIGIATTAGVYYSGAIPGFSPTQYVEVPNLYGYETSQARQILSEAGLDTGNVEEKYTDEDVRTGEVFEQSKQEGTKVPKGTKVDLTVSAGDYFDIGDYVGKNINDVKEILGNVVTIKEIPQASETYDKDIIIAQAGIDPGKKVDPSEKKEITFTVSSGRILTVGDYTNRQIEEARAELEAMGVSVEEVPDDSSDLEAGTVIKQEGLDAGSKIQPGETPSIKLYVAQGKVTVPDNLIGMTQNEALDLLRGKFTVVVVAEDLPEDGDENLKGKVFEQDLEAGSKHEKGAAITIKVYR